MARKNRPNYLTPICITGFSSIDVPDTAYAEEKDPDDHGVFKAMLRMPKDAPETKKFIAELQEHFDQFIAEEKAEKGKTPKIHPDGIPWADELDRETEEPTGNILVRTKLKAFVRLKSGKGFPQRPKLFNANRDIIADPPAVGMGSTVRVSGQVNLWHTSKAGMTLWLEGMQILDLVERNKVRETADEFGFDNEDEDAQDVPFDVETGAKGNF